VTAEPSDERAAARAPDGIRRRRLLDPRRSGAAARMRDAKATYDVVAPRR
jgi:hypothetical protein